MNHKIPIPQPIATPERSDLFHFAAALSRAAAPLFTYRSAGDAARNAGTTCPADAEAEQIAHEEAQP